MIARTRATDASAVVLGAVLLSAVVGAALGTRTGPVADFFVGASRTLFTACVVGPTSLACGLVCGGFAALGPRFVDSLLSRAIELGAAVPQVLVALVVLRLSPGHPALAVGLSLSVFRGLETAKKVRSETLALSRTDFVVAAHALGAPPLRLFRRHVLPHLLGSALASSVLAVAAVLALEAALAFLGLEAEGRSWGASLSAAALSGNPALGLPPLLAVGATLSALWVLAEALEGAMSSVPSPLAVAGEVEIPTSREPV